MRIATAVIVAVAAMIKRVAKVICSLHQVCDCVRDVALMYAQVSRMGVFRHT